MADVYGEKRTLKVTLTMQRNDEETTRSFSVDNPALSTTEDTSAAFRAKLQALQNFLLGDGNKLIQPSNWRDNDAVEEEWTTIRVAFETSNSTSVEWDTRLSRNLQITGDGGAAVTTLSYASLPTSLDSSYGFDIIADGEFDLSDIQVVKEGSGDGYLYLDWYQDSSSFSGNIVAHPDSGGTPWTGTITFTIPPIGVYQEGTATITITA